MADFLVLPIDLSANKGWVVKTTHGNGVVETSVIYETRAQAQSAVDDWAHLDEDWANI